MAKFQNRDKIAKFHHSSKNTNIKHVKTTIFNRRGQMSEFQKCTELLYISGFQLMHKLGYFNKNNNNVYHNEKILHRGHLDDCQNCSHIQLATYCKDDRI